MNFSRRTTFVTALLIFLTSLAAFSISTAYILAHALTDNKTKSNAIIVLGSRTRSGSGFNPCLLARVRHGVNLYKQNYASKIIVSGGYNPDDNYIESEDMKKIAVQFGADEKDILQEKKSTSTFENLLYSKSVMKKNNITSLIIISEPYHLPRADLIAQKLQIPHTVSPATQSPCWQTTGNLSPYLLRDSAALLLYKLQGKIP